MKPKLFVLGLLLIGCTSAVIADGYRLQTGYSIPLYGAMYSPQGTTSTSDPEIKELLKLLIEEVKGLRSDLAAAKPEPIPGTLGLQSPKIDGLTATRQACASCHTGANSKGGYILFNQDNKPRDLSAIEKRESVRRVSAGTMPPADKSKLTPEGKAAILGHFAAK